MHQLGLLNAIMGSLVLTGLAVLIGTPDFSHAKILVDALAAGKDVAAREAQVAFREKDMARRERGVADRELGLAERERELAKRERETCSVSPTIVQAPAAARWKPWSRPASRAWWWPAAATIFTTAE